MNIYGKESRIKVRKGAHDNVRRTKKHASLKHTSRAQQKQHWRKELNEYR